MVAQRGGQVSPILGGLRSGDSPVIQQHRHEDRLPTGDAAARARVDAGDLRARQEDAEDQRALSCGQGPLLYYRAAEGTCAALETDTVPFGCIEDLEVELRAPIRMEPGDIFVALSDGVVDAERMGGERFGTGRVIEVVTRHCRSSAAELTAALREAVADFTGAVGAEDDRTGLVVKRR